MRGSLVQILLDRQCCTDSSVHLVLCKSNTDSNGYIVLYGLLFSVGLEANLSCGVQSERKLREEDIDSVVFEVSSRDRDLSWNNFSGPVPSAVGELLQLTQL